MPPKSKRLQAKDFISNIKSTERASLFRGVYFDIKVLFNDKNKFACVVKKNIFGKAVFRNKARRIVYSVLMNVFKGEKYSVIAYPKKQTLNTNHKELLASAFNIKKEV